MAEIIDFYSRQSDAFEDYRKAWQACQDNPTLENGLAAGRAWRRFIRACMTADERAYLDGARHEVVRL